MTARLNSKHLVVAFGFSLFGSFAALYSFAPALYFTIMRAWMDYLLPVPFADTAYVTSQLECWRAGVDVYLTNPCDEFGRLHAYSPLWLRLWFLPAGRHAAVPLALLLVTGFILSLATLPRVQGKTNLVLLLAAIGSPVSAYAVERANVDLLIFILATVAILCMERSLAMRVIGYAVVMFAALLKFYPAVMIVLAMRERPRVATILETSALIILAAFGWLWHDELLRMVHNIPQPDYGADGLGGRRLSEGLVVIAVKTAGLLTHDGGSLLHDFPTRPRAVMGVLAVLLLGAVAVAHRIAGGSRFTDMFAAPGQRETLCLVVGSALFCGCFITGASLVYREVFLLLTIPALLRFRQTEALGWPVRATAWITVLLMWSVPLADIVDTVFGDISGDDWPYATFAFWLAREFLWWWVFVVMLSGLFCFSRQARSETQGTVVRMSGAAISQAV